MFDKLTQYLLNFRPVFPERIYKITLVTILASALIVPGAIWMGLRIPTVEFLNGMATQSKGKPQSESSIFPNGVTARSPVAGTLPKGVSPYPFSGELIEGEINLTNPLPSTIDNLIHGEERFDIFCQPCHGFKGNGKGTAVGLGRMPAANTLHSEKVRNLNDASIFHILTIGQATMPSYAKQIQIMDRWAVVGYLRALQRAQAPLPEDLPTTTTTAVEAKKEVAL
jgi:mono/diheme cytochrome c family protein